MILIHKIMAVAAYVVAAVYLYQAVDNAQWWPYVELMFLWVIAGNFWLLMNKQNAQVR